MTACRHDFHPHEHTRMEDGRWKPCSGRFWCLKCREWTTGRQCDLPGAPELPAGWLKGRDGGLA